MAPESYRPIPRPPHTRAILFAEAVSSDFETPANDPLQQEQTVDASDLETNPMQVLDTVVSYLYQKKQSATLKQIIRAVFHRRRLEPNVYRSFKEALDNDTRIVLVDIYRYALARDIEVDESIIAKYVDRQSLDQKLASTGLSGVNPLRVKVFSENHRTARKGGNKRGRV